MKPPSTAQQRIAFLDACQREFETIRVVGPVSERLLVRGPSPGQGESDAASTTYTALDDAPTPVPSRSRCTACGASPPSRATTANPFADWNVMLCPSCL